MKLEATDGRTPLALYLHCDTTGPWHFNRRYNSPDQPHAVRIAALLYSHRTGMTRISSWVLRVPKDAHFDRGLVRRHGITRQVCDEIGIEPAAAIARIEQIMAMMSTSAEVMPGYCAYAPTWHINVLKATARRGDLKPDAFLWKVTDEPWWCVMRAATPIVGLPGKGGNGLRFPTIEAAHDYLVGGPMPESSDPVLAGEYMIRAVHRIDIAIDGVLAAAARIDASQES